MSFEANEALHREKKLDTMQQQARFHSNNDEESVLDIHPTGDGFAQLDSYQNIYSMCQMSHQSDF